MKTTIKILLLLITLSSFTVFEKTNKENLKVNFTTNGKKGTLYVAIYDSETSFMKTYFTKKAIDMNSGKDVSYEFEGLTIGKNYAITCFLDENKNMVLDKNFLGIPQEPYGVSNNAKNFFGPPTYNEAKFVFNPKSEPLKILVE